MLLLDEALARMLKDVPRLPDEEVTVWQARGRVLAAPHIARSPLPSFSHSAMDGYAFAANSLVGSPPYRLALVGESRTGHPTPSPLGAREACRIFTGAELPNGADTVVMQEEVTVQDGALVLPSMSVRGEHVRWAGSDLAVGDEAIPSGVFLHPGHLALAAALDAAQLLVVRRPRVILLTTGDELRQAGEVHAPSKIVDTNGPLLDALVTQAGGTVVRRSHVGDTLEATTRAISSATREADIVITTGGVSVGDHDYVKQASTDAGVEIDLWRVAIKPGKPVLFGRKKCEKQTSFLLGLPGNPLSSVATFTLFAVPLIRALLGLSSAPTFLARLAAPVVHRPGRHELVPCVFEQTPSGPRVAPLANRASGSIPAIARATGFFDVPLDSTQLAEGEVVTYRPLFHAL